MNGLTRKRMYLQLCERDGECCKGCGALAEERQLVVDHRDNNNYNNSIDNLQLLCRTCNYVKNPRRPVDLCVSSTQSPSLRINRSKEPKFRDLIYEQILRFGPVSPKGAINGGAEKIGISPVTAKRYLDKLRSGMGPLEQKSGRICFKDGPMAYMENDEMNRYYAIFQRIQKEAEIIESSSNQ